MRFLKFVDEFQLKRVLLLHVMVIRNAETEIFLGTHTEYQFDPVGIRTAVQYTGMKMRDKTKQEKSIVCISSK